MGHFHQIINNLATVIYKSAMNYRYSKAELATATTTGNKSQQKKYIGLTKRDNKYYIGAKQIIPIEDIPEFLNKYYDDPSTGFVGRDRMFSKLYESYLGIPKVAVAEFLKNNETNQVHAPIKKIKVSRPLVSLAPMKCFAIDLTFLKDIHPDTVIGVTAEAPQILFTCIDQFSKFGWVQLVNEKSSLVIVNVLKKIFTSAIPSTIRSDNGSEFVSNVFLEMCREYNIKHIKTDTYSPQQNSISASTEQ